MDVVEIHSDGERPGAGDSRAGRPKSGRRRRWIGAGVLAAALTVLALGRLVPLPRFTGPYAAVAFDRHGTLLSAAVAADGQWRFAPAGTLPANYVEALLHYEDRRFFSHPGIDPIAAARALWQNLTAGRILSGASTLTMQVARLSRPPGPRSLSRKLVDAAMALRLEAAFSKNAILNLYAANAPFGGNVVGVEAAAWRYFGRAPAHLSWAEAAMLAVLPNQPALIHPGKNRRRLRDKRNHLLDALHAAGRLDAMTCRLAKAEPLPEGPAPFARLAPHLLGTLAAGQPAAIGGVSAAAPRFETTIDAGLQRQAVAVAERHHRRLSENGILNLAALVLEVPTGRVLAYVGNVGDAGGAAMADGNQVDVAVAPRSTGSILKPLLYAAMLDAGELLPTQLVPDIPTRMGGFAPQNYTRSYQGAVPAAMVLARSLNVPAVRLLQRYGVDRFHRQLTRLGMRSLFRPADEYGLSLILGGAEGSLWDITGIYAGLARAAAGSPAPFFAPTVLREAQGRPAAGALPGVNWSPSACWLTLEAMVMVSRPDFDSQWERFSSGRPVAWKTGTSYGFRDGWAVGLTPEIAVGVWVGNADGEGRPELTGIGAAAPVMFDLFSLTGGGGAWFPAPGDLVAVEVCAHSGFRAGPSCLLRRSQWVPPAGRRAGACPWCRTVSLDTDQHWQVHARCQPMAEIRQVQRFQLPPAMAWYYRQGRGDYPPLPPFRPDCQAMMADAGASAMSLITPAGTGDIFIPVELDGRRGRIVFEAAHRDPRATIFWHLDEGYVGMTRDIHQLPLAPPPGSHRLTLVDGAGASIGRRFTVLPDGRGGGP